MMRNARTLIIPAEAGNWKAATRLANLLLKAGLPVAWATQGFQTVTGPNRAGKEYPAGSFIVPLSSPAWAAERTWLDRALAAAAQAGEAEVHASHHPFETEVFWLRPARVALFADAGTPYPFADIFGQLGFQNNFVACAEIQAGALERFDALVIPGGGWKGPAGQSGALGEIGRRQIRRYLVGGGAVWGSCAGACNLILMPKAVVQGWASMFPDWPAVESCRVIDAAYWSAGMPGVGRLKVRNANPRHPVMSGMPEEFEIAWHLGPFLSPAPGQAEGASDAVPLLQCAGFTEQWTAAEHMTRPASGGLAVARQDTYAARGIQAGAYGLVAGHFGQGKVVASGCHPEFGLDWLLEQWDAPARILANFVLWAAATGPSSLAAGPASPPGPHSRPQKESAWARRGGEEYDTVFQACRDRLRAIGAGVEDLGDRPLQPLPAWLSEVKAEATFGLAGAQKWPRVLSRMADLCSELEDLIGQLQQTLVGLGHAQEKLLGRHPALAAVTGQVLAPRWAAQCLINQQQQDLIGDLAFAPPADWQLDYGRASLPHLLDSALAALEVARLNFDQPNPPYRESPYILVWGFYLGALYDLLNAAALARNRISLARDAIRLADWTLAQHQHLENEEAI